MAATDIDASTFQELDLSTRCLNFLENYYKAEIRRLFEFYPDERSLVLDRKLLDRYAPEISSLLDENPTLVLSEFRKAVLKFAPEEKSYRINVRVNGARKLMIRSLSSAYINKLVEIEGLVRRITDVRPRVEAIYLCQRCGAPNPAPKSKQLEEPDECQKCHRPGPFKLSLSESEFVDAQWITVQESVEELRGGEHPKQISVYLEDDIVDKAKPGDKVRIVGILRAFSRKKKDPIYEIFLEAVYIESKEREFEEIKISREDEKKILELSRDPEIYQKIINSIAPHIYGHETIKEAIMLQLFGAPPIYLPDGARIRGDSHILLVGEPSTGKSELLLYVAKNIAPRAVYTSGRGATAAGLTAAAIRDENQGGWIIEAGALILADGGIACVDEFDKMRKEDREALHEVMEQQTVSVAKAGITATFNARCAILAAANPKYGRFDKNIPPITQIDLPPTLVSRFDLIFFVEDDPAKTREMARHILNTVEDPERVRPAIPPELLRKYIAYARRRIFPKLTEEAKKKIEDFYVTLRSNVSDAIPITARQLWAVIRLSLASARVQLREYVTPEDVDRAIRLVIASLKQAGIDPDTGRIDIDIIQTGIPSSKRQKIQAAIRIIERLSKEYSGGLVPKEDLVRSLVEELKITMDVAEEIIRVLKENGEIYEPRANVYALAR